MHNGKGKFYPVDSSGEIFVNDDNYWLCPNLQDFKFFGNWQTSPFNTLRIDILIKEKYCVPDVYSDCKVEWTDDDEYFKGIEVMTLANEGRYI